MRQPVIILGGGLAGLTAAIHLSRLGFQITVVERHPYPKHKVCGEYVSNEVLPYLQWLGVDPMDMGARTITDARFSTASGKEVRCRLPLGGFGISRYTLDQALYLQAEREGATFVFAKADAVKCSGDLWQVTLEDGTVLKAEIVLGAYGKRSNLDAALDRKFMKHTSPWLGVKAHYALDYPLNTVGLHNFEGGYAGVSAVEDHRVNLCYLASFESFKRHRNTETFEAEVLRKNPRLDEILSGAESLFKTPLTISQISFDAKPAVENHMLMLGDAAGLIHPLCGNGMAMAIHSAKIASEILDRHSGKKVNREAIEKEYTIAWAEAFRLRLRNGRMLSRALLNPPVSKMLFSTVHRFPALLPRIIRSTHGQPIAIAS